MKSYPCQLSGNLVDGFDGRGFGFRDILAVDLEFFCLGDIKVCLFSTGNKDYIRLLLHSCLIMGTILLNGIEER